MQIIAVIGTRAQTIKMAPVVRAVRDRGLPCELVLTGQHTTTVDDLLADFGLTPDFNLWADAERTSILGGLGCTVRLLWRLRRLLVRRAAGGATVVLTHGDTMTTLIAAVAGRLSGCRVAHVEASLRSGSLLDPFPEELIRRVVTRLADIAYAAGSAAAAELGHSHTRGGHRREHHPGRAAPDPA